MAPLPAFFAIFLQLFGQRELMRATLSHFLSKMGLKRPGGPSSKQYPFPPSSDSSLPESLRVLNQGGPAPPHRLGSVAVGSDTAYAAFWQWRTARHRHSVAPPRGDKAKSRIGPNICPKLSRRQRPGSSDSAPPTTAISSDFVWQCWQCGSVTA